MPFANVDSLCSYVTFEGFDIEELDKAVRIWSPGRLFCMPYEEASAPTGPKIRPLLSEIFTAADGGLRLVKN